MKTSLEQIRALKRTVVKLHRKIRDT